MKHFAVIGHPIGHSLSPLMHNTAFKLNNLNCNYEAIDIEPTYLKQAVSDFRNQKWGGFNVTVPHKEAIIPLLDEVVPEARAIGAVNTVVNYNNKLMGYNTDIRGVEQSLQQFRGSIQDHNCIIIGSGGAARSVVYVLVHIFKIKEITFIALLPEQAKTLANSFKDSNVQFQILASTDKTIANRIKECSLIVNATTVGMYPNIHESPISDAQWISKDHIVFDVIYRPITTRLLNESKKNGARTIGGLEMFIQQGAAAFELWTGKKMPCEKIKDVLSKELEV
jgi:shikimate dehydrogenase